MMTQKGGDYTVELATEKDLHRIWQWNSTVFEPVDICIHHLISNAARQHPDNLAVHAWDGVWTYKQLDDLSTRLAHRLLGLGLEHNFVAPLLFEKSRWFPVAALGVMKAGGASVAMDADQPEERLAAIVGQLKPAVMLCSSAQRDAAGRLAGAARVQEVAEASLLAPAQRQTGEEQQLSSNDNLPMVSPNDKLYINFTSGSTGTPKGVVVTHSNFSSAIQYQQQIHGFKSTSRVYDFASYAFDVSWSNVLHTLTCGACLCIPSDTERKDDLVGSIERYQATHLDVTPSVARLLPRKTFLQLETLVLGGEKVPEEAQDWAASVTVKNPYGPSECTPTATIATVVSRDRNNPHAVFKSTIGKGVGVNTWVVDAETGNSLVAVGATGELWLEGPIVGAGYIGDPEKTAASFVEDPIWLLRGVHGGVGSGHVGRFGRLYKTGDLVRYNEDGSLEFIGRKDSQVKINGQRVELGEIEHHIWAALQLQGQGEPRQPFRQVAAEIVVPQQSSKAILVAFLEAGRDGTHGAPATSDADKHEQGEPEPRQGLYSLAKDEVSGLRETLAARVPGYMIPSTYISLNSFPLTQTGKVDRKKLRAIAEVEALALAFDRQDDATSDENVPQRPPTAREAQLLHLWHSVLGLQPGIIGINDSFLRLGGDSIAAMKLSGALRELGLSLTVADIFTHPRLEDMAKVAGSTIEEEEEPISPYSLLPAQVDLNRARQEAAQLCGLPADQIEDIFPCTPLQEGLLALTAKRPGDYIVRYSLELEKGVDHQRLKAAWDSVIASTPILRTRIVNLQGYGLVQVVVSEFPSLQLATGAEIVADRAQLMGLNTPLARFHVVRQPGHESKLLFVWELHHAVFDGWSIRLVIDKLESIYKGDPAHQTPGFQRFVKHVQLIEGDAHAETFWKSQLEGLDTEVFPALPQSGYQPKADGRYKHDMSGLRWPSEGITASSIVRAATSIMVAAYSNSRDVVFGATVTGRQAAVPGVEQMTGPTIATIPVRISLDPSTSLQDYLQQIQSQSIETTPFEQMGLQRIRKVSPDAERACDFQLLLVVQPTPEEGEETASAVFAHGQADLEAGDRLSAGELDTYAITLECHLDDEGAQLHVSFDTNVVAPEQARRMAQSLEYILCQICHVGQGDDLRIADIEALSTEDAHNIWAWNGAVPEAADVCIHELFTSTARRRPNALAVSAWDGDFTYSQLDNLSTRLAHRLISLNVGPDTVVPLLFDKSKWMSVAVLAVMKAGGCSVAMDSDQPQERLRLIAQQVGPVVVVLCSQGKKELAGQVTTGAVIEEIDQTRFSPLAPPSTMIPMAAKGALPVVNPASRLYVVFTSGSTGTPKGVTVTHSNFSSAIKHQQYAHGFRRSSRVYDFASYTFDVSWSNMLNTFTSGGCLCVPSEAERKGDLAKSIERFRTTHLDITPSVARILPLDLFKQLETLVLGGERLLEEDVKRWAPLVTVKNPYGPCECTPTATLATVNARNLDQYTSSISIGKGLGLNTWVVSSDGSSLAPIGAVGELWLEGPLVGAGYIDEPEKTAAAFIEDPAWLLRGVGHGHAVGGRPGRLYRTGDLVRYKDDYGNLEFVGRKDAQVKINGQRVELGEIEGQMVRLKEIRQAACLLPRSGPCANKLVAVFSLQGTEQGNDKHESTMFAAVKGAHIDQHLVAMQSLLRETLPTYMTPTLWITLESLPLNASGKLDRRKIQAWLSEMDMDTFNKVVRTDDDDEEVASSGRESKVEHVLRDICSRVLNVPSESINMKRSFISNGGDSISAMRLSSESRAANLVFSVADLLKSKSLAGFARGLETVIPTAAPQEEEEFDVDFSLTPIQQWFFAQGHQWDSTPAGSFCNQGFYLKVTRNISPEKLAEAVAAVVANHSMLRARFHRSETDGAWMQRVSKPDPSISRLTSLQLSSMSDVESLAMERHRSLDLKNGPVFSADLCTLDSQDQYLILVAHHLVVDLVSWRVILDDLETVLNGGTIQPGLPFQLWTRAQGERAANINYGDTLSTEGVNNDLDFWHFTPTTPNALMDHDVRHVDIDQQTTSLVFGDVNSILGTEPVDLLLSAVWVAFLHVFPERSGLSIFSEGHGREAADLDLSRTVGWFTTISPIHVSRDVILKGPNGSTFNTVRSVKDARRRLPSNGWAYFASSFLTEAGRNALKSDDLSAMEVVFNYHGKFQQLEEGASLFENVDLKNVVEQGPAVPASSLFGVEVSIEGGMVHYEFSFNRYLNHQDRISQWFDQVGPSLRSICNMLESTTVSRTVCDYEFLSVDYPTLDDFHGRMVPAIRSIHQSEIEDVYPCSPTVDGILLSQQRQPESYKTVQLYEIRSPNPIDLDKLCEAWQKVVAHQPTLRSIFITGLDATAAFNQVVLEHCLAEIVVLPSGQGNRDMAMNSLTQLPPVTYQELQPLHRVAACQVSDNMVLWQVEMSHAITDGASTAIIGQDLIAAYTGTLNASVELLDTTRNFVRSLVETPNTEKMSYWKSKLTGAEPSHFPHISGDEVNETRTIVASIQGPLFQRIQSFCTAESVTVGSLLNSAWALTLAAYIGSESVCFGYLASGRDLPIQGLNDSVGAYANMMTCYVHVLKDLAGPTFVRHVHDQVMQDLGYQHCSLAAIQHELDLQGRPLFNTIVSFQKQSDDVEDSTGPLHFKVLDGLDPTEYDIVVNIAHGAREIEITFDYSSSCMSNRSAARVLSLFQKFATNLASELPISPKEASHPQPTNSVLGALQLASNEDLDDVWSWNGTVPENVQARVHDLIAQQTLRQPDSQAVCAWDGDWTYAQLDTLSTRLAYHLVEMGVGPKVIVPLCFEKSKWTPVAMLGVMKAGGASVAMDTAQPEERLRSIVSQVSPVVVLSSSSKKDLAGRLAGETPVQVVAEDLSPTASFAYDRPLPEVSPSDPMYLVFTSGSTGMPKGVVVTHANIASAIRHQRHALGFTPTSRVYDFASYMFDVVWCDFYQALSIGGCLCIPGDHERTADFIGGIDRLSANIVIFTPSTVRGLEPGALNHLKNLHFIGEPLYIDAFHQVEPHVSITNLYGPSECTTFATAQNVVGRNMQAVGIGHGIGLNTWVVDPVTGLSLMPVGGTGELWLEGPLVTDGYLRDPEKTAAAFVEDPSWLLEGSSSHPGRRGRLYKTGDLVRWNEDGSLTFVGRKDTQVKINGQRVELGEIEHVLRASLSQDIQQVVAEVIIPQHSGRITLVAFIELSDPAAQTMTESELFALAAGATKGMEEKLSSRLPAHMTPSFYIPLPRIPVTATGKTDRKGLREIGKSLTEEQLEALNPSDHERRQPRTAMERKLQLLWSSVLKLDIGKVGADDSFLRLGGDSISAMRLVSAARTEGLSFSVADIFMHPRLSELASSISPSAEGLSDIAVVDKLSLLSPNIDVAAAITEAAALCGVIESQVEDLYPCTPLQEGMLALTAIRPGDYIARCAFELQPSVDMDRFQKAWEEVFASTPILRTRVIDLTGQGLVQAVIDEAPHWMSDKERYETCPTMGLGGTLVRAGLIRKDRPNGKNIFLLTIHHALYDGWSLGMLLGRLEKAYLGQELRPLPDYRSFVKHATSIDEELATEFWRRQLSGSEAEAFPPMPSPAHQSKSDQVMIHHINNLKWGKGDITPSTAVRTALSILIADYSGVEDVVFGATVTGRQANIPGIEDMIGPAIATVPIRVTVDSEQQLHQFLLQVQAQSIEMTAFEQMGLQRIRRLGADAARACQFQTLLVVQPAEETAEWESEIIARDIHDVSDGGQGQLQEVETYALTVECDLGDNGLRLKIGFDSGVMGEKQVQRLVQQFEHILQQIVSSTDTMAVADLQGLNQHDLRDIWSWNATVPETVDVCVHDRIANTVSKQPDSTAVCAWDGDWTYQELDDLSTFLAYKLKRLGVGPDVIVPLCFEKSKWMPVAMLGVMKAGGASVAIDTAQPEARLQSIVQQANPIVVLCSVAKEELAKRFASNVLVVNRGDILLATSMPGNWPALPKISPSSRLYIVFTSGSTGTPKGVVITHSNFSSAITHQRTAQGISPSSRIYDFASYAFDVAWANALTCFESGACLCIPSDADRKDDLNGSIARLKPTHADVTPSAALVLSPESLRQLRTMTVGGERLTAEWARRWSTHVGLKNSYGPSECTPTASFTEVIDPNVPFMGSIGRGAGLNTWVVDAATGESLVAIGSPGELWLEGPLVGAGYLGDPKKTASAFVDNPSWLLRGAGPGHPPRRGRLYKTGDLVRYNQDGSLTFVGRKDTQVKINGQRVELDEIENHMARHDATRQAACLIPASGPCAKRLVGIFSLKGLERDQTDKAPIQLIEGTDASQAEDYIQAANSLLGDSLPAYMVPSIWIALRDLPMTASGKLDRKELNTWLCNMDLSTYKKVANREGGDETHREPQTDAERVLLDACSHVLNMPLFSIDLNRSFISNGGDSISAMRLSSYCRAANVTLSVAGLLKSKSLADFAQSLTVAATVAQPAAQAEDFDVPFTLSPIQQWFFTQGPVTEPDYYFNQGFYVKLRRHFSVAEIENAMTTLVHHHSMLRARFQTVDGTWTQRVLKPGDGVHHFASRQVSDIAEVASLAMQRQRSLDIQNGPVFTADLCSLPARNSSSPEEQFLILIAHHLVVDLVSWRIILDDLETVLTGGTMQSSLSFQTWNKLQQSYASSSELSPEKVLSTKDISNNLEFWRFSPEMPNSTSDHLIRVIEVDQQTTSLLLGTANDALNTVPVELLLSAVWDAFLQTFTRRQGLTIFSEGHGRESWSPDVDPSRTVGWFTTMSPIHVVRDIATNPINTVRLVKDARRQLLANGWAYFTSRYLNPNGKKAFETHDTTMEVTFNYHGQFQELESDDSLFDNIDLPGVSEQGPALPVSTLFNIEVSLDNQQAQYEFSFNRHIAHQDLIQQWIGRIGQSLRSICEELVSLSASPSRTLCDYELLALDYPALDDFQGRIVPLIESLNTPGSIEDVWPCTPTVDGILLSQARQPEMYNTSQLYEIKSRDSQPVTVEELRKAWQMVVARQPSLRSVFIGGLDNTSAFNQVILKNHDPEVVMLYSESKDAAMESLKRLPPVNYQQLRPPHRIALCQTPDNTIYCQVEMSHAITDGASSSILTQEWINAYAGTLDNTNLLATNNSLVRHLKATTNEEKMAFWKTKLTGVEPSHFPHLSGVTKSSSETSASVIVLEGAPFTQIKEFCTAHSVTPASLLQAAWAHTLASYARMDSVCFGYLSSGRDVPIPGIDNSIGAYANMMICRADLQQSHSGSGVSGPSFVRQIHDQSVEDISYQHSSLAEIQHELDLPPGRALFNSIVSFQKQDESEVDNTDRLLFESLGGLDPTEYEIAVGITYGPEYLEVELEYVDACLSEDQASRVLSLLQKNIAMLMNDTPNGEMASDSRHLISDEDIHDIWEWNGSVPETIQRCVHDMITETALRKPSATAVCAWDGDWTYSQLDEYSTRLARRLIKLGVGTETKIVPLCFEKSKWTPIAVLAVMKAGGASVAMDAGQPEDRLSSIIRETQSAVILSSSAKRELASRLAPGATLHVVNDSVLTLPTDNSPLPAVNPASTLYVNFTSGSTGTPKGVLVTHANYASAIHHQQSAHGFKETSRVYDFASYAFDVSWSNILHTLTCGACLCIPSDEDRSNNLVGSIERLQVTHVDVTPSVARLLPSEILKQIETLVLGGEKVPDAAQEWATLTTVKNPYGPSECTPTATITTVDPQGRSKSSIGKGLGLVTWVVDTDGQSLVPVGSVGELWLEGPLVGDGYLGDPAKTAASFVEDPAWVLKGASGHSGRHGRLYRTGDLVRYNDADGNLTFVGRKDTQIKINGQRVELGEIEHVVRESLGQSVRQVIAEVITIPQQGERPMLVAFIEPTDLTAVDITSGLEEKLSTRLPPHMIPSLYIPVESVPVMATGKTDRRRLREIGQTWAGDHLSTHGSTSKPATPMEEQLQRLWAAVLGVVPEQIGTEDSFFRMGGDSITAMRLVGCARDHGLRLSVADILKNPNLRDMAQVSRPLGGEQVSEITQYRPFSLLSANSNMSQIWAELPAHGIHEEDVEDILPVTDHQARLVSLTYTTAHDMLLYHTLDGKGTPDIPRMRAACAELVSRFDMLRTVFVAHKDAFLQVVLKDPQVDIVVRTTRNSTTEQCTENLRRYDVGRDFRFGAPLTSFAIIHQARTQEYRIVVRMSHAQHDGMSLLKMWKAFEDVYNQTAGPIYHIPVEDPSQASFSQHMQAVSSMDKDAARAYWRNLLKGSATTLLKPRTSLTLNYGKGQYIAREIPLASLPPCDFTFSTVLKAAWAYLLARVSASDDIVFSNLTHGRNLPGNQDAFGPCVNIIPTRVVFRDGWRARDLMAAVHSQHLASMEFEQLGPREIVRECTDWPSWAYAGSVVYHHNFEEEGEDDVHSRGMHEGDMSVYDDVDVDNVDVHVTSKPSGENMRLELSFAAGVITERQAQRLAAKLCETITLFHQASDMPLPSPHEITSLAPSLPQAVHPVADGLLTEATTEETALARECPEYVRDALLTSWAEALGWKVPPRVEDAQSFFSVGGDLVSASLLSAHMERRGFTLSIEDIIEYPTVLLQLSLFAPGAPRAVSPLSSGFLTPSYGTPSYGSPRYSSPASGQLASRHGTITPILIG